MTKAKRSWTGVNCISCIGFLLVLCCCSFCQQPDSKKPKDADPPPKSLEDLISRAVSKAVTQFWEQFFEKHGLEPFERALFLNLDEWGPPARQKCRMITISLFKGGKSQGKDLKLIKAIDLPSANKKLRLHYRSFAGKVTSPIAVVSFFWIEGDSIDMLDVALYYDQSKKKWEIVKK